MEEDLNISQKQNGIGTRVPYQKDERMVPINVLGCSLGGAHPEP